MARTPESIKAIEDERKKEKKEWSDKGWSRLEKSVVDAYKKVADAKPVKDFANWSKTYVPTHLEGLTANVAGFGAGIAVGGGVYSALGGGLVGGPVGVLAGLAAYVAGTILAKEVYTDITHPINSLYEKRARPLLDAILSPVRTIKNYLSNIGETFQGLYERIVKGKKDGEKWEGTSKYFKDNYTMAKNLAVHPYTPAYETYGWKKEAAEKVKSEKDAQEILRNEQQDAERFRQYVAQQQAQRNAQAGQSQQRAA